MRFRLGGWAVAVVLVLSSCGVDSGPDVASPAGGDVTPTELPGPELVSARDSLPPAPPSASTLTVLLAHAGDAADPGLDAAAGALAQRPDVRVVIAVPGADEQAETMSGFPVIVVDATPSALVSGAIERSGARPDLVVVGIDSTADLGAAGPIGAAAADRGIPALEVQVEGGEAADVAAAAMQVLDVLDLELDALLDEPAAVHRLTVPSCRTGTLRARLQVQATTQPSPLTASDCTSVDRTVPEDERAAFAGGHPSLARLPRS